MQCCIAQSWCAALGSLKFAHDTVGEPLSKHYTYPLQRSCCIIWRPDMAWKAPKIVEVAVGMEINMYACAARK
jgi:coenzyme PQQ precursor peptide PqqA